MPHRGPFLPLGAHIVPRICSVVASTLSHQNLLGPRRAGWSDARKKDDGIFEDMPSFSDEADDRSPQAELVGFGVTQY